MAPAEDSHLGQLPIAKIGEQGLDALLQSMKGGTVVNYIPDQPHVFPVNMDVVPIEEWPRYRDLIETSLDRDGMVVLMGGAQAMAAVKPSWVQVWPGGDTVVLNSRVGVRVDAVTGSASRDPSALVAVLEDQLSRLDDVTAFKPDLSSHPFANANASMITPRGNDDFDRKVDFEIKPASPSETCTAFGNKLVAEVPTRPITPEIRRELARELRRWCQSGTLADIQPSDLPQQMGRWRLENRIKLNLLTEWALIRSENLLVPEESRSYFWVKTIGEGGGSGFTRAIENTASKLDNVMVGIADVAIHMGWGLARTATANWIYPEPPAYWPPSEMTLFACDFQFPRELCPVNPRLVRLFPSNSFNDSVTVSKWNTLALGGTMKGTFEPTTGKPTIGLDFTVTKTEAETAAATFRLTDIATNGDRRYSRTTRWRPNVAALWDYLIAGRIEGAFGSATPTASTVNPEYEALWALPRVENSGKKYNFGIIFEAGWNTCFRYTCTGVNPPPDRTLESQGRGIWQRTLEVSIDD